MIQVKEIFAISSANVVLWGTIQEGSVSTGQQVAICSPSSQIKARVIGVEIEDRKIVTTAKDGQNTALLFKDLAFGEIKDGVGRDNSGDYVLKQLEIKGLPRPWWRLW